MSLLQEALRKAQRVGGGSSPPPLPSLRGGSPGKPGTRWGLIAGILAAAFAVGVAGVLFLSRRSGPPPAVHPVPTSPGPIAPQASPATLPAAPPAPAAAGASPTDPPAAVSGPVSIRPKGSAGSSRVRLPAGRARQSASASAVSQADVPSTSKGAHPEAVGARKDAVLEKFNAGVAALNRGDPEEAARLLREVTASSPGLVEGWDAFGLALLRRKRLDEADAAFAKVHSLAPRYLPGLLNAGLLRLEQGRIEEGAALFSRAADLSPGALAPRVNLAVAQARLGRFAQAEETLLAAGRRFPGNPDVLYHLGMVYDRVGNRERGTEAYAAFLAASAGSRPSTEDRVRARLRAWGASPQGASAIPP